MKTTTRIVHNPESSVVYISHVECDRFKFENRHFLTFYLTNPVKQDLDCWKVSNFFQGSSEVILKKKS